MPSEHPTDCEQLPSGEYRTASAARAPGGSTEAVATDREGGRWESRPRPRPAARGPRRRGRRLLSCPAGSSLTPSGLPSERPGSRRACASSPDTPAARGCSATCQRRVEAADQGVQVGRRRPAEEEVARLHSAVRPGLGAPAVRREAQVARRAVAAGARTRHPRRSGGSGASPSPRARPPSRRAWPAAWRYARFTERRYPPYPPILPSMLAGGAIVIAGVILTNRGRGKGTGRPPRTRRSGGSPRWSTDGPPLRRTATFLAHRGVVHRDPRVALALGAKVADAREGNVRRAHQVALLRGRSVCLPSLRGGGLRIGVEPDGHLRLGELDRGHVHEVAPQHELLPAPLHPVHRVAGGMAARGARVDAGEDLGVAVEGPELPGRRVGVERRHPPLEQLLLFLSC